MDFLLDSKDRAIIFDWLPPLEVSLDTQLRAWLEEREHEQPEYNGYQFEKFFAEAGMHLDACLRFAKEAANLEAEAVQQAMAYRLFQRNSETIKEIESSGWNKGLLESVLTSSTASAKAFKELDHSLAIGLSTLSEGSVQTAEKKLELSSQIRSLIGQKWGAIDDYEDALQQRHSTAGHALNYQERLKHVLVRLFDEFGMAYFKSKSVFLFFTKILGLDQDELRIPDSSSTNLLEEMISWHRMIAKTLAKNSQEEIEFDHTVHLTQFFGGESLITAADFANTANTDRSFEINLREHFFKQISNLRVRAIGCSCDTVWQLDEPKHRYMWTRAAIFAPQPRDLTSASKDAVTNIPPVILDRVTLTDPNSQPPMIATGRTLNVDPRGDWTIKVGKNFSYWAQPAAGYLVNGANLLDLRLHLRLRGRPRTSVSEWDDFS